MFTKHTNSEADSGSISNFHLGAVAQAVWGMEVPVGSRGLKPR